MLKFVKKKSKDIKISLKNPVKKCKKFEFEISGGGLSVTKDKGWGTKGGSPGV